MNAPSTSVGGAFSSCVGLLHTIASGRLGGWVLEYVLLVGVVVVLTALSSFVAVKRPVLVPAGGGPSEPEGPRLARTWTPFDLVLVVVLVSFSALRWQVGTDFGMYMRFHEVAQPAQDWWSQVDYFQQEAGYTFTSLLVKSMFPDWPFALLWVTSALTVIPVYAVIRGNSNNLVMSTLLYVLLAFYVAPFNIVRQGIAIAFAFWAYSFLGRRNALFVVLGVVAVLFHSSAAAALIVMLIARRWKPTPRSTVLVLGGAAVAAASIWTLPAVRDLAALLNDRYEMYLTTAQAAGAGTYLVIAAFAALAFLMLGNRRFVDRPDWLAMLIIGVAFLIVGSQLVPAVRLFYYFGIFAVLLVPDTLRNRPNSGVLSAAVVIAAGVFFIVYLQNYGGLLPYQTYL